MICYDLLWFVMICYDLLWFVMICYDLLWFVMICYACCICCTCCTRTGKLVRPISLCLCRTFADLKTSSRSRIPRQLGLGPSQGRRSNLWFSLPNLPIVRLWFSGPLCYERRQSGPVSSQLVHASILLYFVPCVSPFSSMHIPFIDVLVICREEGVVERSIELL